MYELILICVHITFYLSFDSFRSYCFIFFEASGFLLTACGEHVSPPIRPCAPQNVSMMKIDVQQAENWIVSKYHEYLPNAQRTLSDQVPTLPPSSDARTQTHTHT
jgi:hypothetical protein